MANNSSDRKPPTLQKAEQSTPDDATSPPPHALGPEKSILSSILQDYEKHLGLAIEEKLTPAHFYLPSHRKLYEVFVEYFEENKPIELVALTQHLLDRDLINTIGGPSAIGEIYSYAPTSAHFESHLEIVKQKFILRNIITSCTEAITEAYDDPTDVQAFLDDVEQNVLEIRESSETGKEQNIGSSTKEVMRIFQEFLAGNHALSGLETGYPKLDKMINGLKATEMFIIAARPSMGKTSLMMNIVENVAIDQQKPVMVFSCEMGTEQIVQRLLFSRASFDYSSLRRGYNPNRGDLSRIKKSAAEVGNSKIYIDDTASITINDLRAKARRKHREQKIELIAVDYLQLMRSTTAQAAGSREREIAQISSGLKALAKELNIPIIVLAQLNRGPETRTGSALGVPRMSDLRESGSIEQDADLVGLLYRKAYYQRDRDDDENEYDDDDEGESELLIAKNRNGETGPIPLTFIGSLMRFEPREGEKPQQ